VFPANGQDYALNRALPNVDLTPHNRVGVASRVIRAAPMRAILLGIKNHETHYQYVRPQPGSDWSFQTFDISNFRRDQVVAMNLYWTAQPGFDRPDEPCIYDLDSLCFWHEESRAAPAKTLPDHIAKFVAPDEGRDRPPVPRDVPPIQEWFPLGVYDGICSRSDQECRWLFDQMRRLSQRHADSGAGRDQAARLGRGGGGRDGNSVLRHRGHDSRRTPAVGRRLDGDRQHAGGR
jgi:hypothetical protein